MCVSVSTQLQVTSSKQAKSHGSTARPWTAFTFKTIIIQQSAHNICIHFPVCSFCSHFNLSDSLTNGQVHKLQPDKLQHEAADWQESHRLFNSKAEHYSTNRLHTTVQQGWCCSNITSRSANITVWPARKPHTGKPKPRRIVIASTHASQLGRKDGRAQNPSESVMTSALQGC